MPWAKSRSSTTKSWWPEGHGPNLHLSAPGEPFFVYIVHKGDEKPCLPPKRSKGLLRDLVFAQTHQLHNILGPCWLLTRGLFLVHLEYLFDHSLVLTSLFIM